jgi:hypothetical protein
MTGTHCFGVSQNQRVPGEIYGGGLGVVELQEWTFLESSHRPGSAGGIEIGQGYG